MPKRKVTDPVTKFTSDLVRTPIPSMASGRRPSTQTYFKRNYIDAVKIITPQVYFDDDISLSGLEVAQTDQLINSHILAANASGVIYVSSLGTIDYLSSVGSLAGLSKYFVKQNDLTWISPTDFEDNILFYLNKSFSDYSSSADFLNYISGTFLPSIPLQQGNSLASNDLASNTTSAFDNTSSGTHKYLIDNLSWMYFLNTSDPAAANVRPAGYSTSGEVAKLLTRKLWNGDVIGLEDSLKVFQKYLWSNYSSLSSIDPNVLPEKYRASGTDEWVSGTQHLERLETLVDVVYNGSYFNSTDKKVEDSFNDYLDVTSLITDEEEAGPFSRAMKAFSFSFADRNAEATELETLVDIDSCPDEFLPYLADLIGWNLVGPDSTRHRNQLRQAVSIYKAKGTKRSVQNVVDTVFGSTSAFNVTSGTLFDLWESYVPNIIFYTLATSSSLTNNGLETFTKAKADELGLDQYSDTSVDTNVRLAVDRIMWELINEFPNNFIFAKKTFPRVKFVFADTKLQYSGPWLRNSDSKFYAGTNFKERRSREIIPTQDSNFVFTYRDRIMPIPKWEDIKYYSDCTMSLSLLDSIKKKLICFGVDERAASEVYSYIQTNVLSREDSSFYRDSFLFFTETEKLPFNYADIINIKRAKGSELLKYLPYWNSKSSHFKILLQASSFDFTSNKLDKDSKYALRKIKTLINSMAPAHAVPDIILDVSTVEDTNLTLSGISTEKAVMGLSSVATSSNASATILTNFAVSTINPRNTSVLAAGQQTVFKREAANSLSGALMGSGVADIFFSAAPRNAIRRKNYKYLTNEENINLRDGKGSAGYDWMYRAAQLPVNKDAGSFYSSKANIITSGIFSLGFIPSTLSFAPVPLKRDPNNFGNLINTVAISPVWANCQAYNSTDSFFGVEVSTTFPLRGLSGVDSSAASSFFSRRGPLTDLQALQHRVKETSFLHEASSVVSGYHNVDGTINSLWPVSSSKIQPVTVSSWYADDYRDIINSMANQLHENTSSVSNLDYMRDFSFGSTLHRFYKEWLDNYTRVPINFNWKYDNPINIISHTYGPYIFNSDFELTASSVDVLAPELITSSVGSAGRGGDLVNIGYYYGHGVMSPSNAWDIINYAASSASDIYVGRIEVRNDTFLSGIEFIDTSNPYAPVGIGTGGWEPDFVTHPQFTLPSTFNLVRIPNLSKYNKNDENVPAWMRASKLEDNLLLKYGRNAHNTFPRLRYKIEPDIANRPDIKNFLIPDSEYQIDINAANIDPERLTLGGRNLQIWVHTEPISYSYRLPDNTYTTESSVWSFFNGSWIRNKVSDINEDTSFSIVPSISMGSKFTEKNIISLFRQQGEEKSSQRSAIDNEVITPYENLGPRTACLESDTSDPNNTGSNNSADIWGSAEVFEVLSFNFNTNNSSTKEQILEKIHTKDRKYYIEIFLETADPNSFVLFDTISMYNKTFREKAHVPTSYNKYELNKYELKTCFDYFTSLAKSTLASRNAITTSGELGVSGGGRLSYRDNIKREIYALSGDGSYNQVSSLIIRGN